LFLLVEWQLKNGVDIDICDDKKRTALHIASASSFAKIVHLLIQYGANVNAKDINENTPLHLGYYYLFFIFLFFIYFLFFFLNFLFS